MKALILMHASHEGPGSLGEVLRDAGASLRTVKLHEDPGADLEADDADLILSLGGPMSAADLTTHPWLAREAEFLARAVREGAQPPAQPDLARPGHRRPRSLRAQR